MEVTIENYRGYDIVFNTSTEKFTCLVSDTSKTSISYSAVKKFIDDYLKDNQNFKPFSVISIPGLYTKEIRYKVVGKRKDGRLIVEDEEGNKKQLSDYEKKNFIVENPNNTVVLNQLKEFREEYDRKMSEIKKKYEEYKSQLIYTYLTDLTI